MRDGASTAEELARIVVSYSVTFWLGLLALGGLSLARQSAAGAAGFPDSPRRHRRRMGCSCCVRRLSRCHDGPRTPIRIRGFELPLPSPRLAVAQLLISSLDWALAGAVLYVLLPPSELSFLRFLGAFLAAMLLGLASHVPGGVGVFEGLMVLLLQPVLAPGELLPSLVMYRAVYYLLPLTMALVALVADEVWQRRAQVARMRVARLGRLTEQLTPRALSVFTFLAGVVLLFSGATPAAPGRLARFSIASFRSA